jgi:hypothetical protein
MRLRQILKHFLIWVIQYKSEYHIPTKDPSENWQKIATHYYNICCELSIRSCLPEFVSFPNTSDLCGQFPCSVPTQTHKLFYITSNSHIISVTRVCFAVTIFWHSGTSDMFMMQGQISSNLLVFRQVLYFFGIYMHWQHTLL